MAMLQTQKASSFASVLLRVCLLCLSFNASYCIDTLKQGESLNSSSQLDSPNGIFTLRFYSHAESEANSTYIAVLVNRVQVAPVVWVGNRAEPLPSNSTPLLTLSTRGELILTRRDGGEPVQIYGGSPPRTRSNVTATLSDTGNFVVEDVGSGEVLWQSYDHPTDTLLPGMKLRSGANWSLTSWLTPTNPAPGAFTLEWDLSAGELLLRRRGVIYWRSGQLIEYYNELYGNVRGFVNFNVQPHTVQLNYNLTKQGDYFMFTVIKNGLTLQRRNSSASRWKVSDEGDVSMIDDGMEATVAKASTCYGYSSEGSNGSRGCQLWDMHMPNCRNQHQTFNHWPGIFRHANKTPVLNSFNDGNSSLSLSDCRDRCWRWTNCECAGYNTLLGAGYGCSYWIGKDLEWDQDLEGTMMKINVLQSDPSITTGGKKKNIGIILGVVSAVVLLLMLGLAYLIKRIRKGRREEELQQLLTLEGYTGTYDLENNHHLKLFTYASIISATGNFSSSNKLGEGGFGPVYKGRTAEGQDIAVKLLSRQSGQGLQEFKNELILISELQHVNLVKLVGFCIHKEVKMIIYEYMPNKSLDFFLFSESKREQLDWQKRFNIIEGTAQGLVYLHKHSRLKIIHRDMKPNNILLDENMIPKISDFGLARIFKEDSSETNTNRRFGTYGYMAPEYAMQGIFSVKSDVYSFGVLVLEIVSGRRNSSFHNIEGPLSIVEYAWELWRKDSAIELMDPMLRDSCIVDQLQKCIHIGLLCVENNAGDRPTVEEVLSMLKNETTSLPKPKNPAFITRNSVLQVEKTKSAPSSEMRKFSANEATLSEIQGR